MSKRAVLIGINYYGTSAELSGCINDVNNIRQLLDEYYPGFKYKILVDSPGSPNKPTKRNIIAAMKWLVKGNNSKSTLFLHYSGHGSYVRDRNGDEKDERDESIIPMDYNRRGMIIDDDIFKYLVQPLVRGAKLTTLFDSCHSGTVLDLPLTYKPRTKKVRKIIRRRRVVKKVKLYNVRNNKNKVRGRAICISGCRDNQTSADAREERQFQGAMTYSFIKIMKTYLRRGKRPTYATLVKSMRQLLKRKRYTQIPQLSTSGKLAFRHRPL